ncbi:acyl--CoA ligase [Pseudooceanicola nitratireducens]|uniref:class I adenylate-forming enzyme family protein n=1 Tax=Pseudooceanicola nitratireducens TaxID=517719 RepID=UPI0031054052
MQAIFDDGAFAPCPTPFNLAAYVLAHADRLADKVALSVVGLSGAERWSYARLQQAVRGTGTGLLQTGFKPGDKILMRLGNTVDFPIAYLGAIAAGLVPVPTSSQLTAREVEKMIAGLAPAGILHDPAVATATTDLPVITTDALKEMRDLPPVDWALGDPDRLAYLVYTSGTSGNARAVMHAHRAIWARRMMHDGWYELSEDDRLMHAGAFNWTYTLGTGLMDPWSVGATALIPAEGVDPQALPLLMKRHEATIFAAAPGVYRKILSHHESIVLPKLRHGLTAGEKVSDQIRDDWRAAGGGELYEAFGMSECSTFISGSPSHPAKSGALGRPQTGRRVAILGPDGPVGLDEEGVIAIHRDDPGLMLGYLGADEETQSRMQGDWFLTGDHGRMDADHQITYMARADDMMNAGGYRVSPLEVEAALTDIPGITEIGVTDCEVKKDARLIIAFYTGPEALDEATLKQAAGERLARYKQPRAFVHIDQMPRNPNGKLLRRALRDHWPAPTA